MQFGNFVRRAELIKNTEFRQPNDLFTHAEYLPLAESETDYIMNDIEVS